MFTPATKKSASPHRRRTRFQSGDSTPPTSIIPNRPATGTPAPWSSRLSVLARIPSGNRNDKRTGNDDDQTKPVYVGEFPQLVRDAQNVLMQKHATGTKMQAGGIDKASALSWIICGNQLFVWNYLSPVVSNKCVVLDIPSSVICDDAIKSVHGSIWMVSIVPGDVAGRNSDRVLIQCDSAGVVICNRKTHAVVYWTDIYHEDSSTPIVCLPTAEHSMSDHTSEQDLINSIIVSATPGTSNECIAIACQSNGKLLQYHLTPTGVSLIRTSECIQGSKGYARSLIWRLQNVPSENSTREFFLLTNYEIQCWNVTLSHDLNITRLWTQEVVGKDGDLGIKKDIAGQKHIWLLDMQIDDRGKEFTILVATLCKDRVSGSSYTQYSLLTMQYKSNSNTSLESRGALERKTPLQIIIPKARVEEESYLFSMRLRVGGKPPGSAVVLSGDGTATVTNYCRGVTRLYQFDLPWDGGRVLDTSVFPSASEENEEGAWIVLTEKAGIWAIPEKAVLVGGVQPPERSLSRKGSSNEGVSEEEKRSQAFSIEPRRVSSEAWSGGERQQAVMIGRAQRSAQDEEAEVLLGRYFNDFILCGEIEEGVADKLKEKGAFEKDGETNVFTRVSKSIVDTFAKHWTTSRGAEFVASAVVSSLLLDKQQKHKKYLQFLALSKCHEELSAKQGQSLLNILEHGEKLHGMIQLRELQNMISQTNLDESNSSPSHSQNHASGALWDLIQIVSEKARRNTVLLMDRDSAEVFYSKVSDIEEVFNCIHQHLPHIIGGEDQSYMYKMKRAFEIAKVCTTLIQTALRYRVEYQIWYPSLEKLMPWNYQPIIRSGLWSILSFIMKLLKEIGVFDMPIKSNLWSQFQELTDILLDAYAGSITIKNERGEEYKGLAEEYCKRRGELLCCLHELTKRFTESKYQDTCKGIDNPKLKEDIFRKVASPLLSIAKRHEGYQTLWQICYDLGDTTLLRNLMHDSLGPKGGFSFYVFKQLVKNGQHAKLLRLGQEFPEELAKFLKNNKDLLWLHQIFLHQFSDASDTIHAFALSEDDTCAFFTEEDEELEQPPQMSKPLPSLADRRRLLNLAKIAAAAGKGEGFEMKIASIEADLHILKVQEEMMRQYPNEEEIRKKALPPRELINLCLKNKDRALSLLPFEIFAWTSSSFRKANRHLLEACWKNAVDQNDWAALSQASMKEGWSDEVILETLKETVLFKASMCCYGPGAEVYDGDFGQVLPLRKEEAEMSVESVLMMHRDFPDAGKLMMTAVVMGKEGVDDIAEEDEVAMDST